MGEATGEIRADIERTRDEMGDTVQALGYKTDVKSRTRDKVTGVKDRMVGATPDGDQAKEGAKKAVSVAQENPLGLALGAVGVGFLAGLVVPSTSVENEKIGPIADEVKDKARETGEEALERGKQVAQEAAGAAKESVQDQGQQQAEELRDSAAAKAEEARQSAGS
jgi:gas vesicle protein